MPKSATQPQPVKPDEPDRREFLRVAIQGGVLLGAAGAGFVAALPVRVEGAEAVTSLPLAAVSALAKLEKGAPARFEVTLSRRDGWRVVSRSQRVYLTRVADGDQPQAFAAFSAVCPHAGCEVEVSDKQYVCPCHKAKFDGTGAVTGGPAPRGLDPLTLSVQTRDGQPWLFVGWQDFVIGTAERTPRTT